MVPDNYRWHYNYVRLAWDSGFSFEKYKRPNTDKNKICSVDINRIVRERDVALVEHHISTVVEYMLDNEQAEVLDTNFVKIFRMGQLAVEYLLFCKKYLDQTVVLLKKDLGKLKEENEELKLYTTDLEAVAKQTLVSTFKCEKCFKMFSSEEYLTSHVKRRHDPDKAATVTDSLHFEVKTLKERLNETEKYLKEKNEKSESEKAKDVFVNADEQVLEIQNEFEKFKQTVELEIANLQADKKGYEEKYNSLFNMVIAHSINKENETTNNEKKFDISKEHLDMTTQTEIDKKLKVELTHNKNVYDFREDEMTDKNEETNDKLEEKINEFGAALESKISNGFTSIEQQMSSFLLRIKELENNRSTVNPVTEIVSSPHENHVSKPQIKPRLKLSQPTSLSAINRDDTAKKLKNELELMLSARGKNINEDIEQKDADQSVLETVDSEVTEESSELNLTFPKKQAIAEIRSTSSMHFKTKPTDVQPIIVEKQTIPAELLCEIDDLEISEESIPKTGGKNTKTVTIMKTDVKTPLHTNKIYKEMQKKINLKLEDIGISPNWKGIPKATLSKALDIVEHRANMSKKIYPQFDAIKKSIEKSIIKEADINLKENENLQKSNVQSNLIRVTFQKTKKI